MNNQTTQDDSSLPIDQTGNSFASLQILDNSNDTPQNVTHQFPLHNDIHSLVQQQIHQQVQHPIYQQNDIQHDTTQSTSQVYSNNDIHITASIPVTGTLSYDMQDTRNTEFQNSS
ncbi:unnamed protein product [Rhizophagus irregularis]|nr:unnamed protein product [Rhizophagus irregularis]